jgi:hypothetical protein
VVRHKENHPAIKVAKRTKAATAAIGDLFPDEKDRLAKGLDVGPRTATAGSRPQDPPAVGRRLILCK